MGKQSKRTIARFKRDYPALGKLIDGRTKSPPDATPNPFTVSVHVQRMDPDLIYRRGDVVDGESGYYLVREDEARGTRSEELYVIGEDESRIASSFWMERSARQYVRDVLSKVEHLDAAKYVIWVEMVDWYEPIEYGLGKHKDWEMNCIIYLPPKHMTVTELIQFADPRKNVELTARSVLNGFLEEVPIWMETLELLMALAKRLEHEVLTQGLLEIIGTSKKGGMSGVFGGVDVMSYVMAARVMVTMEVPNETNPRLKDTFTVICAEPPGEPRTGYQSVFATLDRTTEIVDRIIKAWQEMSEDERKATYTDNIDVVPDVVALMGS